MQALLQVLRSCFGPRRNSGSGTKPRAAGPVLQGRRSAGCQPVLAGILFLFTIQAALADSCPHCGQQYGPFPAADRERVLALRRTHEAACAARTRPAPPAANGNRSTPMPAPAAGDYERESLARAQNDQGLLAYNRQDWDEAIRLFDAAQKNWPDNPVLQQNLQLARDAKTRAGQTLEANKRSALANMKPLDPAVPGPTSLGVNGRQPGGIQLRGLETASPARRPGEDRARAIDAELKVIETRLVITRRELTNITYRLPGYVGALEDWAALGAGAREQARKTALSTYVKIGFETLKLDRPFELPQDVLQRADGLIQRNVLGRVQLDRLVEIRQRLAIMKSDQDVLEILAQVDEGLSVAGLTETRLNREEVLLAMLSVMDLVNSHTLKHPAIGLAIADAQIASDATYGWLAWGKSREQINQLDALGTQQLDALKKLTALHRSDVDRRAALLQEKSRLAPETSAKP